MGGLPALGQTADETRRRDELQRLEREAGELRRQRGDLDGQLQRERREREELQQRLVAAGRALRENEAALEALEDALAALDQDLAARRAALAARRGEQALVAEALQGLAARPAGTDLLAMFGLGPAGATDGVRAGLLLAAAVPALETRARALAAELGEIEQVERRARAQRAQTRQAAERLVAERRDLDRLILRKQALETQLGQEGRQAQARADRVAAQARDVRALIDRLAEERRQEEARREAEAEARRLAALRAPPGGRPASPGGGVEVAIRPDVAASGGRTMPVNGRATVQFGHMVEGGPARGLTLVTRPEALVVAPAAGRIVYAGPFRGYGRMLIIEHPDGYHSLISGLGRIDGAVGHGLRAGEPIGRAEPGQDGVATLYFEVRRQGAPINPAGWLSGERAR